MASILIDAGLLSDELKSCSIAGQIIFLPGQSDSFSSLMESPHVMVPTGRSRRRHSASQCQVRFSYIVYSSGASLSLTLYERRPGEIRKLLSIGSSSQTLVNWKTIEVATTMQSNFRVDFVARQEGTAGSKTGYFAVDQISFTGCEFSG